jgi:hypothetical protein
MNQQTLDAIRGWTSNNKGNQAVAGAANDLFYNSLSASLQRDSDASYAKTMMPLSLEYQRGQQGIATEADLRRLSAEGGIMRDLTKQQGEIDTRNTRIGANAQVESTRIGAKATTDVAKTQLEGTRYTADSNVKATQIGADAQRYGYDQQLAGVQDTNRAQLEGTKYTADSSVKATQIGADAQRYGYDQQLAGVRDTNRSQEEQRRIQGDEDRRTLTQGTNENLRLRADARGAIASRGKRFFG